MTTNGCAQKAARTHEGFGRSGTLMLVALAIVLASAPSRAFASKLHELAPSARSFESDGTRYAAWQPRKGAPIVVLDTRTGDRRLVPAAGCELVDQGQRGFLDPLASAGRFQLFCKDGASQLLDARTGTTIMLPTASGEWNTVGARYVEGVAPMGTACNQSERELTRGELCEALYDIATGAVSFYPASHVLDLNRPGAPPVCQALIYKLARKRASGPAAAFTYSDGLLVQDTQRGGEVRIDRCHGRAILLHGRGVPGNFDVRGGLLTWDTGHDIGSVGEEDVSRGMLTGYRLRGGQRRTWKLPDLRLHLGPLESPVGVFGYSTHTATTVLWIAARSTAPTEKGFIVATWAVYAASFR